MFNDLEDIVFDVENIEDTMPEIEGALLSHYNETVVEKDALPLLPNFEKYYELGASGVLRLFTARLEGSLLGYYTCIVSEHLHYGGVLSAMSDALYLDPAWRGKGVGADLLYFAELELKQEGVTLIMVSSKNHNPIGHVLESLDYRPAETIYEKIVGDN